MPIKDQFGSLNCLVNNAGVSEAFGIPVESLSLEQWNRIISINLTGYFLVTKNALPLMKLSGGSIVNIASTRALQSEADCEAYAASKGGVLALTHSLAISQGPQIRVNSISPGWVSVGPWKKSPHNDPLSLAEHEQHPVGRVGKPEDIASMASYLLSQKAEFITGQNFVVDGGMTKKMVYI